MTRAVTYLRISEDPNDFQAGVTRQRRDTDAFCAQQRWKVLERIVDNDLSASRYAKRARPGWSRLMLLVDAGLVDVIVGYDLDRLTRQPKELEALIDRAEKGLRVVSLQGDLNLASADGRAMARVLVAMAAKESDNTSRRVKSMKAHAAAAGKASGRVDAFGWLSSTEQDPATAPEIARAAERVLTGDGLRTIARDWIDRGVPTKRGGVWSNTLVRQVLLNPRNAGLVRFQGNVLMGVTAGWEPIIDRATYEALVAKFEDPARGRLPRRRSEFTGLLFCSLCEGKMRRDTANQKRVWKCGTCKRVAVPVTVEDDLTDMFFAVVKAGVPEPKPAGDVAALTSRMRTVETRLTELGREYAKGDLSLAAFTAADSHLQEQQKTLRAAVAAAQPSRIEWLPADQLRETWDTFPVERRNTMIGAVFARIVVRPFAWGDKPMDRLKVTFRG